MADANSGKFKYSHGLGAASQEVAEDGNEMVFSRVRNKKVFDSL